MPAEYQTLCRCAKSLAHPHNENHPGMAEGQPEKALVKEIRPPSSPDCNTFRFSYVERI
jgi:hypothetical protein